MIKRFCLCAALMLALAGTSPVLAQSEARHAVELQAQDLGTALKLLAQQTSLQIVYSADLVQGKRAPALNGSLTATEALGQLLTDSGLKYEFLDAQTVTLSPVALFPQERSGQTGREAGVGAVSAVGAGHTTATPAVPTRQDQPSPAGGSDRTQELEKVTVTGTRIRGGVTPSPVITIGAENIREEGFTDLGEVIRSVPQNFNGGQNPGVGSGATAGGGNLTNQNITGGSSLNLRGLGPDATLTLLNGRRMSYSGFVQGIDISAIPVEAVERIEIVADGASAIYGSDAVAGVGNVILKRDHEGVTASARYGDSANGGLTTREYAVTAGHVWSSGGVIATYKDASSDPIYSSQRVYTEHMHQPTTIYPGADLRSGLLSARQYLGDAAELRLDAFRTERKSSIYFGYQANYISSSPEATTSMVSPSVDVMLPGDWTLSIGGSLSKDETVRRQSNVAWASGTETLSSYGCYCNESRIYEVGAEGPLFSLRDGAARLAIGAGYRSSDYFNISYLSGTREGGDEASRFAYAELNLPLVGPESSLVGVRRLSLTAAVRGEDHDSFGMATTPKLGLIYAPSADFTLKASWGRSFKAPTLLQRYQEQIAYLWTAASRGGSGYAADATVLMTYGGNPDLEPERARTTTASLAFHPDALPGLEAELTWFDIDYTDRVMAPVAILTQALSNPNYDEFVNYSPTVEQQAEILTRPTFYNYAGAPYDPNNVVAIVIDDFINVARQRISGFDLSGSYRFGLGDGQLTIRGSASWLDSSRQNSARQAAHEVAGTIFNPAGLNSRLGAVWSRGGFTASTFANYTSGVTSALVAGTEEKTASFTTFDAALRYGTGARSDAWSGLELVLSVQNMFDRAPPLHTVTAITNVPYDSTNYSAIGRFVSLSVSKHW